MSTDDDLDVDFEDHSDGIDAGSMMGGDDRDDQDEEVAGPGPQDGLEANSEPEDIGDGQDEEEEEDITATVTSAEDVDWAALFKEFDAHTPDAAGQRMLSEAQMPGALAGSEQDISDTVDPDAAVEAGLIDKVPSGYQHEVCRE